MKPVLLGMNNPLSSRPEHALYPEPPRCTGWNLWKMLHDKTGATQEQYLEAFDRRNLLNARRWDARQARAAANSLVDLLQGRVVVVLGAEVVHALGLPRLLLHPQVSRGVTWRQLPHPSGRCHWYNDPKNREVASLLLEELYLKVAE